MVLAKNATLKLNQQKINGVVEEMIAQSYKCLRKMVSAKIVSNMKELNREVKNVDQMIVRTIIN